MDAWRDPVTSHRRIAYVAGEPLVPVLKAPRWVLDLSPFHHVAAVPVQPFDTESAVVIVVTGLVFLVAGVALFRGRDLAPA